MLEDVSCSEAYVDVLAFYGGRCCSDMGYLGLCVDLNKVGMWHSVLLVDVTSCPAVGPSSH